MSESAKTRQSSMVFGLGSGITQEDSEFKGSRLPTSLQVLRCLMYHIEEGAHQNLTKWESSKLVLSKISVFYEKANIPMITERKSCEKILKLHEDNTKLRAIPVQRRNTTNSINKVKKMEEELAKTFSLWPKNVECLIKNPEDLAFLRSMKSDRLATFGAHDKILHKKIKRREMREISKAAFYEKTAKEASKINTSFNSAIIDTIDSERDENSDVVSDTSDETDPRDQIYNPESGGGGGSTAHAHNTRSHHRTIRTGTYAFIPHDIIKRPDVISLATRLKMTPAQQALYTKVLIAEAGGDSSKITASYATSDRARRSSVRDIAKACKDQWNGYDFATLHWDTKLLPTLTNPNITEERLAVIVGNSCEIKLLGVPAYPPGTDKKTGDIIANLTTNLLNSWNCSDSIVNMSFDTTASNTGHITAACVAIQERLGKALLWSACRHHIGEIILSHVFDDLKIEASKSPDISVFKRFRKHYTLLQFVEDSDSEIPINLSKFDDSSFSESAKTLIDECKNNVIKLAKSNVVFCRGDYLEFVQLCLLFLVDDPNEITAANFKRPGALHKARWMAKLIYSIKICLFQHQIQELPAGTITTHQQVLKIRNFVNFVTLVYSSWWMTCTSVFDAPWNDLQFFHLLIKYSVINSEISESAIKAFTNHLWYVTEETVPLALWSDKVPEADRRVLADSMLAIRPANLSNPKHRFGMGFGKPKFPKKIDDSSTLSDFVGIDSWFLFFILKLDSEFMVEDVKQWPNCISYQTSKTNLKGINVVNDCAERGIKLTNDFLTSAKTEDHYQNILQVVEHDRKKIPNLRKRRKID